MVFTETDIQYIKDRIAQNAISDSSLQNVTTMKKTDIMPIVYYEQSGSGTTSTNRTITKQDFFKNNDDITEVNFKNANIDIKSLNIWDGNGGYRVHTDTINNYITCIFNRFSFYSDYNKDGGSVIMYFAKDGKMKVSFEGGSEYKNTSVVMDIGEKYTLQINDVYNNKKMNIGINANGITRTFTNASGDYNKITNSIFYNTAGRATYFQSLNTGAITTLLEITEPKSSSDEGYNTDIIAYTQLVQDELPSLPTDFVKGDTRNTYVSLLDLVEYTAQLKQYIEEQIATAINRKQSTEMSTEMQ